MNIIKKLKLIILVFLCITGLFVSDVKATGSSSGEGIADLSISETTSLNFGSVVSPASQETVVILSSVGATATSSGATLFNTSAVGVFAVTGEPSTAYHSHITSTNITFTSGSDTMSCVLTYSPTSNTLDSSGDDTVFVGGTLTVGASQAVGSYTSTFEITVHYD